MEHELNAMDLFLEPRSENDELLHTAFNLASRDMLEQLQQLLDRSAAKQLDCTGLVNGFTMAHTAAKKGNERILTFLLDRFPELRDAPTKDGRLPIHLAAYEGHRSILQLLHDRGANTEATDSSGHTALHFACWAGHLECARFLVQQMGADVSARTHEEMTALQFASAGNHLNIVKFLQDQSAALNTANSGSGQTPLHKACMFGSLETVRHLIENDPELAGVADVHGNSPLHVASAHGYRQVVDFLLQHTDAAVDEGNHVGLTPLHRACAGKHAKVVRTLIANGADPHKRDDDGHTALHHSAAVGDAATITLLCKCCNVVIEPESSDGSTPIDLALQAGFKETASLIAKHLAVSMRADKLRSSLKLFSPHFEKKEKKPQQQHHQQPKEEQKEKPKEAQQEEQQQPLQHRPVSTLARMCDTFVELCNKGEFGPPGSTIPLDAIEKRLDVFRRRLFDMLFVLEGVSFVSQKSKTSFVWHGRERLNQVLGELQDEAIKLWPEDARNAGLTAVDPRTSAETKAAQQRVSRLGRLTQSFIQLFLVGNRTVCVQDAVNKLKEPGSDEDPMQEKGRLRRLYDIMFVLISIGLLEKEPHQPGRLTLRWVGIPPMQLRQQYLSEKQASASTDTD